MKLKVIPESVLEGYIPQPSPPQPKKDWWKWMDDEDIWLFIVLAGVLVPTVVLPLLLWQLLPQPLGSTALVGYVVAGLALFGISHLYSRWRDTTHGQQRLLQQAQAIAEKYGTQAVAVKGLWGKHPFLVAGPEVFANAVLQVLREAEERAPHRLEEALRYFGRAFYTPEYSHEFAGRSDGLFSIDGSDYWYFRKVFWHEVGHCVDFYAKHQYDSSQESANAYAGMVIREIGG